MLAVICHLYSGSALAHLRTHYFGASFLQAPPRHTLICPSILPQDSRRNKNAIGVTQSILSSTKQGRLMYYWVPSREPAGRKKYIYVKLCCGGFGSIERWLKLARLFFLQLQAAQVAASPQRRLLVSTVIVSVQWAPRWWGSHHYFRWQKMVT